MRITGQWRFHTITAVKHIAKYHYWEIEDDQDIGTFSLADKDLAPTTERGQLEPRVGDRISYYGYFGEAPATIGCRIEAVALGEAIVWDYRERIDAQAAEVLKDFGFRK